MIYNSTIQSNNLYRVSFIDWDGTLLQESYVNKGTNLTPPTVTPSRSFLQFDSWNKTSYNNVSHNTDVGINYVIIDSENGNSVNTMDVLEVEINPNLLTPFIGVYINSGSVTIDWGDGTTDTSSVGGQNTITKSIPYPSGGDYTIKVRGTGQWNLGYLSLANYSLFGDATSNFKGILKYAFVRTDLNPYVFYREHIRGVVLAHNGVTSISDFSFSYSTLYSLTLPSSIISLTATQSITGLVCMKYIIFPSTFTTIAGNLTLYRQYKVKSLDFTTDGPMTIISAGALVQPSLEYLYIKDNSVTSNFGSETLADYCNSDASIKIPEGCTGSGSNLFRRSRLKLYDLPSTFATFGNTSFGNCERTFNLIVRRTTPPTITSTAFPGVANLSSITKIYVPDANVDAYKTAIYWSTYAAFIYPLSQYKSIK